MVKLNPYLNFLGNTEVAFNFYKSIFGGEFTVIQRFKETAQAPNLTSEDQNKIMHIALPLGKNILMGTDALPSMGHKLKVGDNISLSISTDTKEETERIFNALLKGGTVGMALSDMFWRAYFGMCTDKFGVQWMISYEYPKKK